MAARTFTTTADMHTSRHQAAVLYT